MVAPDARWMTCTGQAPGARPSVDRVIRRPPVQRSRATTAGQVDPANLCPLQLAAGERQRQSFAGADRVWAHLQRRSRHNAADAVGRGTGSTRYGTAFWYMLLTTSFTSRMQSVSGMLVQ